LADGGHLGQEILTSAAEVLTYLSTLAWQASSPQKGAQIRSGMPHAAEVAGAG